MPKTKISAVLIFIWLIVVFFNSEVSIDGVQLSKMESGLIGVAFWIIWISIVVGIAYLLSTGADKLGDKFMKNNE